MENNLKHILLKSLDVELSPIEQKLLDEGLAGSASLRKDRQQLLGLRASILALYPEPDPVFSGKVMARLREQPGIGGMIINMFPKVAAACLLLFLLSLLGTYVSSGSLTTETIIGLQDLTVEDAFLFTME